MNEERDRQTITITSDHLKVAGQVLSRAPASLAEQMVIEELFRAMEALFEGQGQSGGGEEQEESEMQS